MSTPHTPADGTAVSGDTTADRVNATLRYTMWSVFALDSPPLHVEPEQVAAALAPATAEGLVVRGWYDLSGMAAGADLMVWWHAPRIETLQRAYRLARTRMEYDLRPVWSATGLHRPAEFNRGHVPAFMAGEPAGRYLCVYPFVRSYEWYLLPEAERRELLVEHGVAARPYPDVRANTVSSFGLSDYEWILAFEAPELHRIVDLMRDLRATGARRHVREEVPFWTGPRVEFADLVETLDQEAATPPVPGSNVNEIELMQ